MKKWKQKAIVQKIISYLPFSRKINFLFQKYVTKGVTLSDEYFYDRLGHVSGHIKSYQQYAENAIPANCLEIGLVSNCANQFFFDRRKQNLFS